MPHVKLAILGLMAVFALSATTPAVASALTHQWSINGTTLASGSKEEIQGNGLPSAREGQFEATVLGINLQIHCQTAILPSGKENVLTGGAVGTATVRIEFTGCGVFSVSAKGVSEHLSSCKVGEEPIVAKAEGELIEAGVLTLGSKSGETFATFKITKVGEASCAVEAKDEINGTQACTLPHYAVNTYAHELECTPGCSTLTLGSESARLYLGAGITLEKGGKWHSS
jgi:hypothetical protein